MNHRDRVQTALSHERPDRCPMQISFTPEFAGRQVRVILQPEQETNAGTSTEGHEYPLTWQWTQVLRRWQVVEERVQALVESRQEALEADEATPAAEILDQLAAPP